MENALVFFVKLRHYMSIFSIRIIFYKEKLPQINIMCTMLAEIYPCDLNSEELFRSH